MVRQVQIATGAGDVGCQMGPPTDRHTAGSRRSLLTKLLGLC